MKKRKAHNSYIASALILRGFTEINIFMSSMHSAHSQYCTVYTRIRNNLATYVHLLVFLLATYIISFLQSIDSSFFLH